MTLGAALRIVDEGDRYFEVCRRLQATPDREVIDRYLRAEVVIREHEHDATQKRNTWWYPLSVIRRQIVSRKNALQPLKDRMTPHQSDRRDRKIAARRIVAAQLTGGINLVDRKIAAFATMGFFARLGWLIYGRLPNV